MRAPRFLVSALLLPFAWVGTLHAGEPVWLTDLTEAKKIALKENKPLLIYFTGSSWCGPCKMVHAEVLSSPEFAEFAKNHILVMLDYPPFSERSEEKVKADPKLANLMEIKTRYKVPGFPTVIVLSPDGHEKARKTGYGKGLGAAAFLAGLKTKD